MAARLGNYLFLISIGLFGLYYYLDVRPLPNPEERLIVVFLFWCLVVLLAVEASRTTYQLWKDKKGQEKKGSKSILKNSKALLKEWIINKQALLFLGLVLYLIFIPIIGFFVTSAVFLITCNYFLRSRKLWEVTILPVGFLLFIYVIFIILLEVRLPVGLLI